MPITPAVIVAIVSVIVGSIFTYLGFRLNRKKEEFATHIYARSIFKELFDHNCCIEEKTAEYITTLLQMVPNTELPKISNSHDLILALDNLINENQLDSSIVELKEVASKVSAFHYSISSKKMLIIHSIIELIERHGNLLNNFEKYIGLHTILVSKDNGFLANEKWLQESRNFYTEMKKTGDFSSMVRMGITLVGVETEKGFTDTALNRLNEISSDEITQNAGFDTNFLQRRFQLFRGNIIKTK